MIREYPISERDNINLPPIGKRFIHKGGNVWEVVRYANVYVDLQTVNRTVDKGICVFLKCLSGGNVGHWRLQEFRYDFHELMS